MLPTLSSSAVTCHQGKGNQLNSVSQGSLRIQQFGCQKYGHFWAEKRWKDCVTWPMIISYCPLKPTIETTEININIWHISPTYQLSDLEMNNCGLHGSCVVSKVVEVPSFFNRFAVLSRHTADNSIRYGEPVHKVDWSVTNTNSKLCSRNVWIPSVMSTSTWMVST